MIDERVLLGIPLYYEKKDLYIKIPTVADVSGVQNYSAYVSMFTTSQEDIWDRIAERENKMPNGKPVEGAPTPFEDFLLNCYASPFFMQLAIKAFKFWTNSNVKIIPATKTILFLDNISEIKEARFLKTIEEEDFFDFQNLIRIASGSQPIEPPKPNENPKVALIKAKGRYRERIKKKKGNKNSISFSQILVALCCMNTGLNPLNIGEVTYPAINEIFYVSQLKEKYETDLTIATAGFGNQKIKPKYWIQKNN